MLKLGVNVDHVATLRQARLAEEPNPVKAAVLCELSGAYGITAHLREDRRHINDNDMSILRTVVKKLNMEMALTNEMLEIALDILPDSICIVPEKRQELTTEGGLDALSAMPELIRAIEKIKDNKRAIINVSLFIDPDEKQIHAAAKVKADYIELHTGMFANAKNDKEVQKELERLILASELASSLGLKVNAGHGIDYINIDDILQIPHLEELNIGHSIIARSIYVGINQAVEEMLTLMSSYKI